MRYCAPRDTDSSTSCPSENESKLEARCQRVDENRLVVGGRLQQAELGPVRALAQEFGVNGDEGVLGCPPAKIGEGAGRDDELHERDRKSVG